MARGRGRGRGRIGARPSAGGGGGRGRAGSSSIATRATAEAGREFDPAITEGEQEVAGSKKRQADLGSWYAQLAADYQSAQNTGSAALGKIGSITAQQEAEASARSGTEQGELSASDAALANLVGGPKDTAGLAKIAAAGAAAERGRVSEAAPITAEQANFVANLGADKASSRLAGIEARQAEGERRDKIKSTVRGLRGQRSSARVADEGKLTEAARSYATEEEKLSIDERNATTSEQAAAAAAALAQLKAQHEETQDAIGNRQSQERIGVERTNAKISRKNARTSARAARATAKHYEKENTGALSTAEKRARGEHQADAMAAAKALLGIKVPKSEKEWSQFEAALIEKLGSSYAAQAAAAVAKIKKVQNVKARKGYIKRLRSGKTAASKLGF